MEYLTSNEIAKKWNVSSRMVAYYCKAGKIVGAIMRGKTWLIPAHAEKPSDHRYRKNKMMVQDNPELQGALQSINKLDSDNSTVYRAKDLYQNLGLTRETLRYYEEIGLIAPERNQSSQYREFTFEDVSRLMSIDFYKKRGFSPLEHDIYFFFAKPLPQVIRNLYGVGHHLLQRDAALGNRGGV